MKHAFVKESWRRADSVLRGIEHRWTARGYARRYASPQGLSGYYHTLIDRNTAEPSLRTRLFIYRGKE